ncbi:MAG: hypothetical protein ACHQYO_09660 [Halanaerobiales bacterium]
MVIVVGYHLVAMTKPLLSQINQIILEMSLFRKLTGLIREVPGNLVLK